MGKSEYVDAFLRMVSSTKDAALAEVVKKLKVMDIRYLHDAVARMGMRIHGQYYKPQEECPLPPPVASSRNPEESSCHECGWHGMRHRKGCSHYAD